MFYYNIFKYAICIICLSLNKRIQVFGARTASLDKNPINLEHNLKFQSKFSDENQIGHEKNGDGDDLYIDLEISSHILSELGKILNETQQLTKTTNASVIKNLKNSFKKPSALDVPSARNNEYLTLIKIVSNVFKEYKYYLFTLVIVVGILIISTIALMLINFLISKKYSNSYDCNNAKFKKNISFDFIDNGYLTNRGGHKLKSLNRKPAKLDKDYHFENFTRRNSVRSFDRVRKTDTFENIYELPCMEAIDLVENKKKQQSHLFKAASEHSLKFKTFSTRKYDSLKVIPTRLNHTYMPQFANRASEEQFDSNESNDDESIHAATLQPNTQGLKFKFYSKYEPTMISFCHEAYNPSTTSKCLTSTQFDRVKVVRV